jgi:hypothetical protein
LQRKGPGISGALFDWPPSEDRRQYFSQHF